MTPATPRGGQPAELLVARQPILDRALEPHGYELLWHVAAPGTADGAGDDRTSRPAPSGGAADDGPSASTVARGILTLGLRAFTGGRPAYVDVTRALVVGGLLRALDPALVVLELGRDVHPDDAPACEALAGLRDDGYRAVLDDCRADDTRLALLDRVEGVKVDFAVTTAAERGAVARAARTAGVDLVATGVDERGQADEAFGLGCRYVQGYFFARPLVLTRRQPPGYRRTHLRLLRETARDEPDVAELERIVKSDLALSHQLLRFVNAPHFAWRRRITSMRHAFVLLGREQVRQWVALVVLADLAQDQPQQLAVTACVRARFCELLGALLPRFAGRAHELFLLGMFSVIDAVLARPMVAAISGLPLPADVGAALLGRPSPLAGVLDLVVRWERGDWDDVERTLESHALDDEDVLRCYLEAVDWVSSAFDRAETPADDGGWPAVEARVRRPTGMGGTRPETPFEGEAP